jgi:hypothetical protein
VEGGASATEVLERFDPDDLDRRPAVFGREALEELGMQGLDGAAGAP